MIGKEEALLYMLYHMLECLFLLTSINVNVMYRS